MSKRRDAILAFVVLYQHLNGYAPTVREIADAVGLASPGTVHSHLAAMRREGRITYVDGKPRTLRVVA